MEIVLGIIIIYSIFIALVFTLTAMTVSIIGYNSKIAENLIVICDFVELPIEVVAKSIAYVLNTVLINPIAKLLRKTKHNNSLDELWDEIYDNKDVK